MIKEEVGELLSDDMEECFQQTMDLLEDWHEMIVVPVSNLRDWVQVAGDLTDLLHLIYFQSTGTGFAYVETLSRSDYFSMASLGEYPKDDGEKVESFSVVLNLGGVRVGTAIYSDFALYAIDKSEVEALNYMADAPSVQRYGKTLTPEIMKQISDSRNNIPDPDHPLFDALTLALAID